MTRLPCVAFALGLIACDHTPSAPPGWAEADADTLAPVDDVASGDSAVEDSAETALDAPTPDSEPVDSEPDAVTLDTDADIDDAEVVDDTTSDTTEPDPDTELDPDTDIDPDTGPDSMADTGPAACDPPLRLEPSETWIPARRLVTLRTAGGTGAYRYELASDASHATLNVMTGAYLSGDVARVTDRVRVFDRACAGEAFADIHVTAPLAIVPAHATIAPGGHVAFGTDGGSGSFRFDLVSDATGAVLDPTTGDYRAGDAAATDRIRLVDLVTGEESEAVVESRVGAALRMNPSHLYLPVGSRYRLATDGGSGIASLTLDGDAVHVEDGWFVADSAGEVAVHLVDDHTGQSADATVSAILAPSFPSQPSGDSTSFAVVRAPGDLDGDGWDDVIVAVYEADVGAWDAGALLVYAGTPDGLDPAPARVISGPARQDHLGRGFAVGDLDGDGRPDLAVGVIDSDLAGGSSGAVLIYPGVPDGFFAPTPSQTLLGRVGSDLHGHALAMCDFNGDGRLDLAVGARFGEDRTQVPVVSNTGAIHLYLGSAQGLGARPDQSLWGRLPGADGKPVHSVDMNLGWEIAAGDIDGDGLCDLVGAGIQWATATGRAQDGAVVVFRGRAPDALSPGGVSELPVLAFVGNEADSPQSRFGWSIAVGDLDGDGAADLAIGQPYYQAGAAATNGAVRVLRGGALPDGPATEVRSPDALDWSWYGPGNEASDFFGWSVAIGDADGVPPLDLVVGNLQDEVLGGPANAGTVHLLPGRVGAFPDASADRVVSGDTSGQRFGVAAALIADRDGDGRGELVVRAAFDNGLGPRVGETMLAPSLGGLVPLETPFATAGGEIGAAVLVLPDVDGDGAAELAIGGPRVQADVTTARIRAGAVAWRSLSAEGLAAAPHAIDGFSGHASDDRLGDALAVLDFDGDGTMDLAVVSSSDDTGSTCVPARTNNGAVHVFLGGPGGFGATPAFSYHGDQNGQSLNVVAGADLDGDGMDDLVVASRGWDVEPVAGLGRNVGGVAIVRGRALEAGTVNLCTADRILYANAQDGQLGSAVERLGDIDDDGCEDVALGVHLDDALPNSSGSVRLLLGWGPSCAALVPRVVGLTASSGGATVGFSLHGGVDVDDDGRPDLAVGGPGFTVDGNAVGAAWIVSGSWLATASEAAVPWVDSTAPPWLGLAPADVSQRLVVTGRVAGERLGAAVALVAPAALTVGDRRGAIAVGRPAADIGGIVGAGAVSIHRVVDGGLDPVPVAVLGGESARPFSEMGYALSARLDRGVPVLVAGARRSSAHGLDDGAVFLVVDPLRTGP